MAAITRDQVKYHTEEVPASHNNDSEQQSLRTRIGSGRDQGNHSPKRVLDVQFDDFYSLAALSKCSKLPVYRIRDMIETCGLPIYRAHTGNNGLRVLGADFLMAYLQRDFAYDISNQHETIRRSEMVVKHTVPQVRKVN